MPIYQVTILQTLLAQEIRNVWYYETTSLLDSPQKQEVVDEIRDDYVTLDIAAALTDQWTVRGAEIRQVDVAGLPAGEFTFTSGDLTGSDAANKALPAQVAILLRGTADTPFPRNTRIYHGGLHAGHMQDDVGLFTSAVANDFDLFLVSMDQITPTGDALDRVAVHWDRVNNVVDDWNRVNTYDVAQNPVIQRRRRRGSGI